MSSPRTGIATVCLSGTLRDKLDAAARAGFDGVEIFEPDLVASSWSPAEIRRHCADLGLSIDLYQPFRDFDAQDPDQLAANLRRAERKFDLVAELGADTVLACSSVHEGAVTDDDRLAAQLRELAERAGQRGIRVAYEALAWGRHVDTCEHSWEIVRRADHPALGVCLDSFHVLSRGGDPAGIREIPGEKVFFLQLADAPPLDMDVLQWSRHHRLFPGQGSFALPEFLEHVLATGYGGPLSLEVFNDVFRQADPRRAAVDALRSLIALQERTPSSPVELPSAPRLDGHAFAEVAADPSSAPQLARALRQLGFARTGQHRTKPVGLWEQGGAGILLNESTADSGGLASVGALAVRSADPARSARRAEELLAPVLPRERGADEANLSAVAAPDGTSVFFCDESDSWRGDFDPTGERAGSGGLTGIDHVALTQPFDHFDEAALFYRSVLGLHPESPAEFAAPFGLVRSQAVADRDCSALVVLSVALLRRGDWAPGVSAPQHVAFGTDDIFATARGMAERGAPALSIPDNYYDDLAARLALPPERVEAMRRCGILHDRDEHGEFLHFYTEVLADRVFFEVVQRTGGYAGYGVTNAPVRMAAHRELRAARG
jgi:4-hydroxyphenylpyruvate dioxygenase